MDANYAVATGRLVKEADLYESDNGIKVINISIATERRSYKGSKGAVDYIPCVLLGSAAEIFYNNQLSGKIKKGDKILVTGLNSTYAQLIDKSKPDLGKYTEMKIKVNYIEKIAEKDFSSAERPCDDLNAGAGAGEPGADVDGYGAADNEPLPFDM